MTNDSVFVKIVTQANNTIGDIIWAISVVDKATDEVVYTSEEGEEFYSDMVKALISQQEGE